MGQASRIDELEIDLEIGPEGVRRARPAGAVLSFLAPERPFDSDVMTRFCHHIHFFASAETAHSWVRERPGHLVLSLEEGVELARRKNRCQYAELLPASSAPADACCTA